MQISNIVELKKKLDDMFLSGKALKAFDERYAKPIVMQVNSDAPFVGKALNRVCEIVFFSSIEKFILPSYWRAPLTATSRFFGMGNGSNH